MKNSVNIFATIFLFCASTLTFVQSTYSAFGSSFASENYKASDTGVLTGENKAQVRAEEAATNADQFTPDKINWLDLDAVAYDSKGDKYHFFFGTKYVTKDPVNDHLSEPKSISAGFKGFPKSWEGGNVDAVLYNASNDCYYFFKGDEYARKPRGQAFDKGPIEINAEGSGFKGLSLEKIGAACYNAQTEKYYFFDGRSFQSKKRGEAVNPNVKSIGEKYWKGCPFKAGIHGDVVYNPKSNSYYFFNLKAYAVKPAGQDFNKGIIGYHSGKSEFKVYVAVPRVYQFEINYQGYTGSAGTIEKTGTSDNITIRWYGRGDVLLYEEPHFNLQDREQANGFAYFKTDQEITRVTVSSDGENGLWIDYAALSSDTWQIKTWGKPQGKGYCVSNDPQDAHGSWKNFVGSRGCQPGWSFNVPTSDVTPAK